MADTNALHLLGGKKVMINRYAKKYPTYNPPTNIKVGVNSSTPTNSDTALTSPVPISDGTVLDDASNTLTGSSGGDNTTDNTTTYKEGAGTSDVTSQNLIKNNGNATAIWTIADLSSNGNLASASQYFGMWLYIKDSTALAKFVSSGTALEIKIGSDTSNYYSITFTASTLSTGWNWITDSGILTTWTETGTVAGNLDTFIIEITTNNATDTFVAGDVLFDLARQWQASDLLKSINTTVLDESTYSVTHTSSLTLTQANGFLIDGHLQENDDSSPIATNLNVHTDESKSSGDIFTYVIKTRLQ